MTITTATICDAESVANPSSEEEFVFKCLEIALSKVSDYLGTLLEGDATASTLETWPASTADAMIDVRLKGTSEEKLAEKERFASILSNFRQSTLQKIRTVEATKLTDKNAQSNAPLCKIKEEPLEIKEEVPDEDDYSAMKEFVTSEESQPDALPNSDQQQGELNNSRERSRKRTISKEDKRSPKKENLKEGDDQMASSSKKPKEEVKEELKVEVKTEVSAACTCQCRGCERTRSTLSVQSQSNSSNQVQVASGVPAVTFRTHKCIICLGHPSSNGILNGKKLDFTNKFQESCYHYAMCYYDTTKYYYVIPPGENNLNADGSIRDHMGKEVSYSCTAFGCQEKKGCGYRAYFMHMATKHGKLEEILEADDRPGKEDVLNMVRQGRMASNEASHVRSFRRQCKMRRCPFVSAKQDNEELKRHYALNHLRAYFTENREDGKPPRVRHVEDENKGVLCKMCGSDVRVTGSTDDVIFHLAVKHDKLRSALQHEMRKGNGSEYNSALVDLYPNHRKI